MIRSFILITLMVMGNLVFGQSKVFKGKPVATSKEYSKLSQLITKYDIYEIDATSMHQYFQTATDENNITLELGDKYKFDLDLQENHIFKKGIQVRYATENGIVPGELTKIKCYQGFVHGTNDRVALSANKNLLSGLIQVNGDEIFFEPLRYMIPDAPENQFIFYRSQDYIDNEEHTCIAKEVENSQGNINDKIKGQPELIPNACKEVELGEASDKLMCTHYGSVSAVQDRITTVINAVQTNYNGSFNDNLTLIIADWFNVTCTGTDPWSSSTNAGTLLNSFTAWGPSNFSQHDVGELWTYRDFDGGTVGIAWVQTVCTSSRYNCIQDFTTNLNIQRVTVAHEIGHNFSCNHDVASNFIMSPTVNNTNTWSAASIASFNAYVPTRTCLAPCSGGSPPVADFTSNKTSGCKPLTVQYTDLSTNSPTSWLWQFPGGTPATSNLKNPTIVYNTPGVYNVTLTATNASGANTITKNNYMTILDKPTASFTFVKNLGVVTFTNTSVGLGTSYWDFGDGDNSTEDNPTHEYLAPGPYVVTLTVTNSCGTSVKIQTINIVFVPQANFSSNVTEGCVPFVVSFQDESLYFPTSWLWTFPGGTPATSTQQNPTVTYSNQGQFKVTLVVSNSAGSDAITIEKYITAYSLPVANFTTMVNGLNVTFTNTSQGTNNTYDWDFGDGGSSSEVNPVHTYTSQGDYIVTLTVSNDCGSVTINKLVIVLDAPEANFSSNVTTGCNPLTVQFTDQSTHNPNSWHWLFVGGNPSASTQKNPTIVYNSPGQYSVRLIVSNAIGVDTLLINNYITVRTVPTASFNSTVNGSTVTFNNTSTYGNTYLWNFGDNLTSNQQNPVHTYSSEGVYTVTLTVTNECGTNVTTHTVEIVFPPSAAFSSDETSGCDPLTVNFNNTSSPNATTFNWSFPGGSPSTSTQKNPTVVYNNAGTYNVRLIAGNNAGLDTIEIVNYITVKTKPAASFNYSNNNGLTSFQNNTTDGTSWNWDFGDSNSSTDKNPDHAYAQEGPYTVILYATNACGTTVSTQVINVVFPPDANFSSNTTSGCQNLTVTFADLSSPGTTAWNWSFPGGSPSTSTQQHPTVTYNSTGFYDVTLIATNAGGKDTILKQDYILVSSAPPVANFSYNSTGLSYNFFDQSNDANSYKWNFGDGNSSNSKNPLHTYADGGVYTVQLISFNGCGSDTITQQVNVIGAPPVALFQSSVQSGCLPLIVNFQDNSLGGTNSWIWNFDGGDPATSNVKNPVVIYNNAGVYPVKLIVFNNFGSDTLTQTSFITVGDVPKAKFTYLSQAGLVNFTNTSTGGTVYLWNFGDGTTSNEQNPVHAYSKEDVYTVTLTVTNDCGSAIFTQTVDLKVSVNDIDFIESMKLYPNPNSGTFNLSFSSKKDGVVGVQVLDVIGRKVAGLELNISTGINSKEIELNNVAAGQYLVLLSSEGHYAIEKIMVK